ncbi:uncharacterized protein [Haliotis cracherodii]|uniref:uncharacterized protein n=1 Tax=Haliotis cracherodii TaxID=6455 RepID=UPI0039E776E5
MKSCLVFVVMTALARVNEGQTCGMGMIEQCAIQHMSAHRQGVPSDRLPQFCSDAGRALDCMDEVVATCPEDEKIGAFVSIYDDVVSDICEEIDSEEEDTKRGTGCSARRRGLIRRCARRLRRLSSSLSNLRCRRVRRTVRCLRKNMARCPSVADPALTNMMTNLSEMCEEPPFTRAPPTTLAPVTTTQAQGICPDDFMMSIQTSVGDISAQMQVLSSGATDRTQACSSLTNSLDRISNLTEDCRDNPQFASMAHLFNVDQIRTQASFICPSNGGGDGCPSNFRQQIMDCVTPIHSGVNLEDTSVRCSMARRAFSCVDDLVATCGSRLGPLLREMQLDQARQALLSICQA